METGKIAAGTSFYIRELEKAKGRIAEFEQRLAAAESRLDAGEALLNRMSMNLILSGYSPELDKNNPMNDFGRVVEWKKGTFRMSETRRSRG